MRLIEASNGNMDALADISPIRGLIEQGCDLEADVLPVVARLLPELSAPAQKLGRGFSPLTLSRRIRVGVMWHTQTRHVGARRCGQAA